MSEPDNKAAETDSSGGFFTVGINQIDRMVSQGADAPIVMAYLVLARGAGGKAYSTWGAGSCAKYTELTYYRAEQAIEWLEGHGYIRNLTEKTGRQARPKWRFEKSPEDVDVALANMLIDGIGKGKQHPPMKRIDDLPIGRHGGLNAARLDALMVMLHLYRHQELADFGGINPNCIYRAWQTAENEMGEEVTELSGTNAALYEIEAKAIHATSGFLEEALFYVDDPEERAERFWDAVNNLQTRLGWLYEATQIWTGDPMLDKRAEPHYTLYVHDRHARDTEPYLAKDIHSTAFKMGALDRAEEFWRDDYNGIINSGRFRYIARRDKSGFPIGIYRLRFRPHTRDSGKGMAEEKRRVAAWRKTLETLH